MAWRLQAASHIDQYIYGTILIQYETIGTTLQHASAIILIFGFSSPSYHLNPMSIYCNWKIKFLKFRQFRISIELFSKENALKQRSVTSSHILSDPGGRFNIKIPSYQYRNFHYKDKNVLRSSYIYNGNSQYPFIETGPWCLPRCDIAPTMPNALNLSSKCFGNLGKHRGLKAHQKNSIRWNCPYMSNMTFGYQRELGKIRHCCHNEF